MSSKSLVAGAVLLLISVGSLAALTDDARLVQAVRRGSMETARELIKQRIDVNAPHSDGTTALHWAVELDNREMVALLVSSGANVNIASDFGVTPLALACRNGNAAIVSMLLRAGANVNTPLRTGETPLMTAARTGRAEVVNVLLEADANLNAKEPEAGQNALMWAIAEGHVDVVRTLIKHGANVRDVSRRGFTPLLFAARNGDVETTRVLFAAGIDVNDASGDGTTALTIATIRSQVAYAKFLLELGADPNKGPGFTPMHWVVGDWDVELAGDKTHVRPEGTEWDLTLPLRGQARLDYLTMLLDYGADVNATAQSTPRVAVGMGGGGRGGGGRGGKVEGATAFFMAAQMADVPLMRFLLAKGANALVRTARNVSPLMAAAGVDSNTEIGYTGVAEADAVEAIKLCLELGDDVHTVSTYGENALHGAAYRGNAGSNKIAQLLLDRGIEVHLVNKRGWSPVTLAEGIYTNNSNSRNPDLERLLLEHGGRPSPPDIERDAYAVIVER